MVEWTRKKSFWPILSAMGCLFVLAVVAPQAWQRYQTRLPLQKNVYLPVEPQRQLPESRKPSEQVVILAPQAKQDLPLLAAAEEVEGAQLPPVVSQSTNNESTTDATIEQAEMTLEFPSTDETAASIPPAPIAQKIETPEFNFDILMQMRDALVELVDQLPKPTLQTENRPATGFTETEPAVAPDESPTPVQVNSPTDRLAMLDRRQSSITDWNEHNWSAPPQDEVADNPLRAIGQANPEASENPKIASRIQLPALQPTPADEPTTSVKPIPLPPVVEPEETETRPREPLLRYRPKVLFTQLEHISSHPTTSEWSKHVRQEVARLSDDPDTTPVEALQILEQLTTLAASGHERVSQTDFSTNQLQWSQAIQSLERRLAVWKALLDPSIESQNSVNTAQPTAELLTALSKVAAVLTGEAHGQEWHDYLKLDQIAAATSEGQGFDQQGRSKLAQAVLARLSSAKLTVDQKAFVATEPIQQLQVALQPWAATSINLDRLAGLIELYEAKRELRFGLAIAQVQQHLRWSNSPQLQELAEHLDQYYRGSNMRLAITDDLMNQMLPKQESKVSPVRENIAGANVRGKARTTTDLRVQLIPDDAAWKISFEAFGKVYSTTRSETWPARVRNAAKMQYQARKTITIDHKGLNISPAKAKAQGRHELLDVDSELDGVPLLGFLLRDIAKSKNKKSRPRAISQVKQKVARQARERMDNEADPKFESLEQRFRSGVLGPIEKLALIAEPRSMFTTEDRAVMQLRLANEGQLAAHTPRPLAPSDSAASMQMHETVLNNALAGLQLDGQRMKVVELFDYFSKKFSRLNAQPPAELSRRAIIQFAKRDAVLLSCDDDRVKLVLNISEVAHGRDKIRSFQVHAYFRPVLDGLDVRLVRDGTLQFSGRRLKTGPRMVLHSVFGKLLEKGTDIHLLPEKVKADPRLQGLMVTQLVIDDGWIGLALGPAHPQRTAWRSTGPHAETMMR